MANPVQYGLSLGFCSDLDPREKGLAPNARTLLQTHLPGCNLAGGALVRSGGPWGSAVPALPDQTHPAAPSKETHAGLGTVTGVSHNPAIPRCQHRSRVQPGRHPLRCYGANVMPDSVGPRASLGTMARAERHCPGRGHESCLLTALSINVFLHPSICGFPPLLTVH